MHALLTANTLRGFSNPSTRPKPTPVEVRSSTDVNNYMELPLGEASNWPGVCCPPRGEASGHDQIIPCAPVQRRHPCEAGQASRGHTAASLPCLRDCTDRLWGENKLFSSNLSSPQAYHPLGSRKKTCGPRPLDFLPAQLQ